MQPWFVDEHPQRKITLPAFYIDKYEVTQAAYAEFLIGTGRLPRPMLQKLMAGQPPDWGRYPIVNVTWYQAREFCAWAGKRLPTEAEWEKAARGVDGREFPWGNDWDPSKLNAGRAELPTGIGPVGLYEAGRSAYGAYDMAGNVSEWTEDWYQGYPGADFVSSVYGQTHKAVRGGGWGGVGHYALTHFYRAAYRDWERPDRTFNDIGFRCARDARNP
jgi:formylglycine-generating enzyme required for sulfatase activity